MVLLSTANLRLGFRLNQKQSHWQSSTPLILCNTSFQFHWFKSCLKTSVWNWFTSPQKLKMDNIQLKHLKKTPKNQGLIGISFVFSILHNGQRSFSIKNCRQMVLYIWPHICQIYLHNLAFWNEITKVLKILQLEA